MELVLWRHAEAEEHSAQIADGERRLTKKGRMQAKRMGEWLDARLPASTRILVSPARRTRETAAYLGREFAIDPRLALGRAPSAILAAASETQAADGILIVGHQPSLGRLAALLLAQQELDWSIKKGAVWWFNRRIRQGKAQTVLRCMLPAESV